MKKLNLMKLPLVVLCGTTALFGCGGDSDSNLVQQKPDLNEPGWRLVWSDEFSGSAIDKNKWEHEHDCWGGGNGEQQCYTPKADNSFVEGGYLNIIAKQESYTGPDNNGNLVTLPYTSARLRTMNKGDWTYGRFEIRAQMPSGQGTWPAIWMLPTDYVYGGWAASGEIDIMEAVNLKAANDDPKNPQLNGTPERRVHGTLHYGGSWPHNVHSGQQYYLPDGVNPSDAFHTYAVEWEKDEIRWYVDDIHYATQRSNGWYSQYWDDKLGQTIIGSEDAPFNQDFHILLNLAVGGNWAGNTNDKGIDPNVFPQTMKVDFVRVYECAQNTVTGKGCATISPDAILVDGNPGPKAQQ
ncbi:glycoside hydrolase family 16 protein [Vibrio alfacsensis]|uniref:glycoside hydrolase family 16 protein n=1 Tax=Vibrio TaxID=662 RepID=UPI00406883CB